MREFFRGTAVAKKPKGYAVGIRAGRYGFLGGEECVRVRIDGEMLNCCRNIESGYEDQPNTPSKSKIGPRRPAMVYMGMVSMLFLFGMLFVRPDVGFQDYVRHDDLGKDNIGSRKHNDPHRPRNIENSEARQREALEIADTLNTEHLVNQDSFGQLSGGGANFQSSSDLNSNDDVDLDERTVVDPPSSETGVLSDEVHEAVKEDPSMKQAAIAAAIDRPETVVVSQPLVKGGSREITVDSSRVAFLESLSDGLESEDLEGWQNLSRDKSWWLPGSKSKRKSWRIRRAVTRDPPVAPSDLAADSGNAAESCKIHVLDVNKDVGPEVRARNCNLNFKRIWPFSRRNWGIDGVGTLAPEDYQYASEYWLAQSIRSSSMYEENPDKADLIFVDMFCYHMAWLAYIHPLGNRNTTDPEPYMRKTLDKIVKSQRFTASKGGDFVFVHPSPIMRGLFKEEAMCEDLASAFHLVPERSSLCVWTPDSASRGLSLIMPYVATLDLDLETDLEKVERDLLLYYRGGCGHPHPSVRGLFAAGKMLRYHLVHMIETERNEDDIDVQCSCDICDNHTPHHQVMEGYRRSRFCPVLPSNTQSSRRLSEVILSGCIPVFIGPPFHSLPLELDVDYKSMGIFINVTNSNWIDANSSHHLQNRLVSHLWPLDDSTLEQEVVHVDDLREVVDYLRNFPQEEEFKKRRSVLQQRFKFYYGPVPTSAGGDGVTSELADLAMKHMCRHAAQEKRKIELSESQGISTSKDVLLKLQTKGSVMKDKPRGSSLSNEIWSFLKRPLQ